MGGLTAGGAAENDSIRRPTEPHTIELSIGFLFVCRPTPDQSKGKISVHKASNHKYVGEPKIG